MRNVMIDLETMSTAADASVVQIGAVEFELMGQIGQTFKANVRLQDCIDAGMRIDGSTVAWWLKQSEAARLSITAPGQSLVEALDAFTAWIAPLGAGKIWGNGADFDVSILRQAYRVIGREAPWAYNAGRCMRTFKDICLSLGCTDPVVEAGVLHDALEDAKLQVKVMQGLAQQMAGRIKR